MSTHPLGSRRTIDRLYSGLLHGFSPSSDGVFIPEIFTLIPLNVSCFHDPNSSYL
jgi:hypothetical protein